jgi:hypothetical protein
MLHNLKILNRTVKGPMLEILGFGIFTQIRPVWMGDLGTNPKNSKSLLFGLKIVILYVLALLPTALKQI